MSAAVEAAHAAHATWSQLSGSARARHLYSIARHVQKHARLIAVLEALDNGKSVRETRDADVPTVVRHLYHHAGWAELAGEEGGQLAGWSSVGVVAAIVPWNFPLMLLVWKVAPALAMGNTVVLKPATYTRQDQGSINHYSTVTVPITIHQSRERYQWFWSNSVVGKWSAIYCILNFPKATLFCKKPVPENKKLQISLFFPSI